MWCKMMRHIVLLILTKYQIKKIMLPWLPYFYWDHIFLIEFKSGNCEDQLRTAIILFWNYFFVIFNVYWYHYHVRSFLSLKYFNISINSTPKINMQVWIKSPINMIWIFYALESYIDIIRFHRPYFIVSFSG